jgi:hypothetical protein
LERAEAAVRNAIVVTNALFQRATTTATNVSHGIWNLAGKKVTVNNANPHQLTLDFFSHFEDPCTVR